MSSRRSLCAVLCFVVGCAAFRRGEYWDAATDGDPGDASGPPSASSGPTTIDPDASEGSGDPGSGDVPETTGEASSGGATGPSFLADVLPLLRAGCERCHTADGAASSTAFLLDVDDGTAYDMTLEFVDLDDPAGSRLLAKTAGQGHTGGVIYDDRSAEYAVILAWIEHGALP